MFRCPFGRNQPKISRCQIACSRCKLPTVQQVGRPAASEGSTFTEVAINTEIGILRTVWFDLPGMWCRSPHLSVGTTGNCTVFQRNWIHGILSLQQVWPARRRRWWCILAHPSLGVIPWQEFPQVHPQPMVSSLLGQF